MNLRELIKQSSFASPAQEAILNLMVTNSWIVAVLASAMAPYGVTPAQYNVLRILGGVHPARLTCTQVGERMLDRTPDVTRLLDRLERSSLIERARAEHDRRVVEVAISKKGIDLLEQMEDDVAQARHRATRHLSDAELKQLSSMLDTLRTDQ